MSHDIIEFNSVGLCKNQHKYYNVLSCQQPESESLVFNINSVMHSRFFSNQDQDCDIILETNNKTKTSTKFKASPKPRPCLPRPRHGFVNGNYIHHCYYIIKMYLVKTLKLIIALDLHFDVLLFVILIII